MLVCQSIPKIKMFNIFLMEMHQSKKKIIKYFLNGNAPK